MKYLASYSYKHGTGIKDNTLSYDDLSDTAENSETFGFLSGRWSPLTFSDSLTRDFIYFWIVWGKGKVGGFVVACVPP